MVNYLELVEAYGEEIARAVLATEIRVGCVVFSFDPVTFVLTGRDG